MGNQNSQEQIINVIPGQIIEVSNLFDPTNIQVGTGTFKMNSGTLTLDTIPSGADIFIENWPIGKTPLVDLNILAGKYTITLLKNGYRPEVITAIISERSQVYISRSLTPLKATVAVEPGIVQDAGTLDIKTIPEEASIFIDGFQTNGASPLTISDLLPGTYEIIITKEGYDDYIEQVTVASGQTTNIDAELHQRKIHLIRSLI